VKWQIGFFLFLLAGASGCDYLPWDRVPNNHSPVGTTRAFLAAARRGDCNKAWTYFSPATQEKIHEYSRRQIRSAPYYAEVFSPYRIMCIPYESYRPSTVRLRASDGQRATVLVMERVPDPKSFALPGWSPIGRMDAERTIDLTHVSGGWKVLPHVPEDPRAKYGEKTYDIGRAVVVTKPGKLVDGVSNFMVEATMRMNVSPADLERVLADPARWPKFWPHVTSARWLGEADAHGYRPLSVLFTLPEGPRDARIFFHQAGNTQEHSVFSFGFASEYRYWGASNKKSGANGTGRLRWAGTFFAGPDHGPGGGSSVRWSQTIDDARLAHQDLVAAQLAAFEREAKRQAAQAAR
jgi:hypothetical protein